MTFAHIISPDAEYIEDRDYLFNTLRKKVHQSLQRIVAGGFEVSVTFDTVQAFNVAIIMKGTDDGTYNKSSSSIGYIS